MDVSGNELRNAKILDSRISDTSIVATDVAISGMNGMAYFDGKLGGRLRSTSAITFDEAGNVIINTLYAPLNARGHEITNATLRSARFLDSESFDVTEIKSTRLYTQALSANNINLAVDKDKVAVGSISILGVDSTGNIVPLPTSSSSSSAAPLGSLASASLGSVSMDSAHVVGRLSARSLSITGILEEAKDPASDPSFLIVGQNGKVSHTPRSDLMRQLQTTHKTSDSIVCRNLSVSHHIEASSTSASESFSAGLAAQTADIGSLSVRDDFQFSTGKATTLQVQSLAATVASFQETIVAEIGKFSMLTSAGNESLILQNPIISNAILDNATMTNMDSLQANRLDISSDAHFGANVFIGKSLTVQGSVVGSGAYVDSSDVRFKKHIRPFEGALDKLMALSAVSSFICVHIFAASFQTPSNNHKFYFFPHRKRTTSKRKIFPK